MELDGTFSHDKDKYTLTYKDPKNGIGLQDVGERGSANTTHPVVPEGQVDDGFVVLFPHH